MTTDRVEQVPAVALLIFAHPDDPEVAAGGTIAKWAAAGSKVHVCVGADGDKGSMDPAAEPAALVARRREETAAAGAILGVAEHHWLGYSDGELEDGPELVGRLVEVLRRVKPVVVVAPDPTAIYFGQHYVNHRDHRHVGWASLDAVTSASANPHYFPAAGPPHQVEVLYLAGTLQPDCWVDVSATIDVKAAAVACHASQLGEPGEWLRGAVRERAEDAGRQASVAFAEAFRRVICAGG